MKMRDTVIGAAIYSDVLTTAIREGDVLHEPMQHALASARDAIALLLEQRVRHRHDEPVIFLEAGSTAGAVLEGLLEADKREGIQNRDRIVNGLSPAESSVGAGVQFYDRRSELHYRFRERAARDLRVPPAYNDQLAAFGADGQTKEGRVFFPYVGDVAEKLGRWPALAVAAVLAAIDAPLRRSARKDYDPYSYGDERR
jgi:hypothetical protein